MIDRHNPAVAGEERLAALLVEKGLPPAGPLTPGSRPGRPGESIPAIVARQKGRDPKQAEKQVRQRQAEEDFEIEFEKQWQALLLAGRLEHLKVPLPPLPVTVQVGIDPTPVVVVLAEALELVVSSVPVVGQLYMLVTALSGQSLFTGRVLSRDERVLTLFLALLPTIGKVLKVLPAAAALRLSGKAGGAALVRAALSRSVALPDLQQTLTALKDLIK